MKKIDESLLTGRGVVSIKYGPKPTIDGAASPVMSEEDFQSLVVSIAKRSGWLVYHTYDSRRSAAGFPDLCMVRGDRLIFAELKSAAGVVTDSQTEWLARLGAAKAEVYLWRPRDLADIVKALS